MESVGKFVTGSALLVLGTVFYGFTLSALWGWFVVPLGAPSISIANALGLGVLIGYLTKEHLSEKDEKSFWDQLLTAFIQCAVTLGIGYLYHLFM